MIMTTVLLPPNKYRNVSLLLFQIILDDLNVVLAEHHFLIERKHKMDMSLAHGKSIVIKVWLLLLKHFCAGQVLLINVNIGEKGLVVIVVRNI